MSHAVEWRLRFGVLRSTAMMRFSFVIAAAIVLSLGGIAGYLIPLF